MYDVRHLFRKLAERDRTAEERVRLSVLRELLTHTVSFAAFFRAAQAVEFAPLQPDRETSIAILMAFRIQQLLAPTPRGKNSPRCGRLLESKLKREHEDMLR